MALCHRRQLKKTVSIYDRGSQFELLRQLPVLYMWTSPVPYGCLTSSGLIQKTCSYPGNIHKDLLIYRNGYRFSKEEEEFLRCLFTDGKPSFRLTRRRAYIKARQPLQQADGLFVYS
ncbi:MAG: hypothetical protein ACLTW9_02020 [Enterocloster sp.]